VAEVRDEVLLGVDEFRAEAGHWFGDVDGDGGDSVDVAMDQVARGDGDAADADGDVDVDDLRVAVRADAPVGEDGEVGRADLVQIAPGAAGDQADGSETLIRQAHQLAEGRAAWRVVEVLEHDDRRGGRVLERGELPALHAV